MTVSNITIARPESATRAVIRSRATKSRIMADVQYIEKRRVANRLSARRFRSRKRGKLAELLDQVQHLRNEQALLQNIHSKLEKEMAQEIEMAKAETAILALRSQRQQWPVSAETTWSASATSQRHLEVQQLLRPRLSATLMTARSFNPDSRVDCDVPSSARALAGLVMANSFSGHDLHTSMIFGMQTDTRLADLVFSTTSQYPGLVCSSACPTLGSAQIVSYTNPY